MRLSLEQIRSLGASEGAPRPALDRALVEWMREEASRPDPYLRVRNAWGSQAGLLLLGTEEKIRRAPTVEEAVQAAGEGALRARPLARLGALPPACEVLFEMRSDLKCPLCTKHHQRSFPVSRIPEHLVSSGHGRLLIQLSGGTEDNGLRERLQQHSSAAG